MAKFEDVAVVKEALRALGKIIKLTYNTLTQAVRRPGQKPPPEQLHHLSHTLEHIGNVREGFILSQRTSPRSELAELRYLVRQVMIDWQWIETMGLALHLGDELEFLDDQLIAYRHALIVLGMLPRLPAQVITFPQHRPTYADVPVPTLPAQMLERIEEIERTLYRASLVPLEALAFDAVRRTYAFFEAGSWMVDHHLAAILRD